MAPLLPLVLAERGDASTFLSVLTSLVVVLLVGGAWLATRRRWGRATAVALVALVALLAAAWLPRPALVERDHVEGFLTGEARIPVVAEAGAPLVVEGGEGRIEPGAPAPWLTLRCPTRCAFRLGAAPAWAGGPAAALPAGDSLGVELRGGPLSVEHVDSVCQRLPVLVAWMHGGDACAPCSVRGFLAGAGHDGPVRLAAAPSPVC